jgi:nicotinamidase/pyrazinamidase
MINKKDINMYIRKESAASFDVDPQNTFTPKCPDELPIEGGDTIASELNMNASQVSIRVGSKDAHSPSAKWIATSDNAPMTPVNNAGRNVDVHWDSHAMIGSFGFDLIEGLPSPEDYDFFIWKGIEDNMHPYGACYHDLHNKMSTGVIEYLHTKGISHVIVGGLAFDYCVKNTALQLNDAGFVVIINLASTKAISDKGFHQAKQELIDSGVKFINSVEEIKLV